MPLRSRRKSRFFEVLVQDMVLRVAGPEELYEQARASGMQFWEQLQSYSIRNPDFRTEQAAAAVPPEDAPAACVAWPTSPRAPASGRCSPSRARWPSSWGRRWPRTQDEVARVIRGDHFVVARSRSRLTSTRPSAGLADLGRGQARARPTPGLFHSTTGRHTRPCRHRHRGRHGDRGARRHPCRRRGAAAPGVPRPGRPRSACRAPPPPAPRGRPRRHGGSRATAVGLTGNLGAGGIGRPGSRRVFLSRAMSPRNRTTSDAPERRRPKSAAVRRAQAVAEELREQINHHSTATTCSTTPRSPTTTTTSWSGSCGARGRVPRADHAGQPDPAGRRRAGRAVRARRAPRADAVAGQRVLAGRAGGVGRARARRLGRRGRDFVCELKIDGLAVSLRYESGRATCAAPPAATAPSARTSPPTSARSAGPERLRGQRPRALEVRGEVYLPVKALRAAQRRCRRRGERTFANPRNAAAGSLRQKDPA